MWLINLSCCSTPQCFKWITAGSSYSVISPPVVTLEINCDEHSNMAQKSQNRPIKLLSPLLQSPCSVSPSCLGTHVQESCGGFPSCPFSQVSTPQDPSESIGLTAQNLRCYFSKPRCPCYVLSHCFGGKQTPPPPNLTENTNSQFARFKVVLKAGYFRC